MRRSALSLGVAFLFLFAACSSTKSPIVSCNGIGKYFPIRVGNLWQFDFPEASNPWSTLKVTNALGHYYVLTFGDQTYTVCVDGLGNIWRKKNGREYLWFDFSKKDGEQYRFDMPFAFGENIYYYYVTVHKDISVETPAGIFQHCISFSFDVPNVVDEEQTYFLAPDVGPVKILTGWFSKSLLYAVVNGDTIRSL